MSAAAGPAAEETLAAHARIRGHRQIVLLTDGYSTPFLAKTAISLARYRSSDIVAVLESQASGQTAKALFGSGESIPVYGDLSAVEAADAVYLGIAPPGGKLPTHWKPILLAAISRGLDVVSGLHDFLVEDDDLVAAAKHSPAQLIDVRRNRWKETAEHFDFSKRSLRVHTVGHDCSVGKMVTTLEIQRALTAQRHNAEFVATGQTGIMISGRGVPVDCVVADFVNGAVEQLVKQYDEADFVLIEGQGSISHPAFSAVTLGLLHGCAPDGLIFCYQAGRKHVKGIDKVPIPPLSRQIAAYEQLANLRHPCRVIGIAVNTRDLNPDAAAAEIRRAENEFGLPACDVYRQGPDKLVAAVQQLRSEVISL
ncbi:DUF1611 domain-containing protein [Planctomycetaceae bacterium SH139]